MISPTGRGSSENHPLKVLPITCNYTSVHEEYKTKWKELSQIVHQIHNFTTIPKKQSCITQFSRVWMQHFPRLKIAKEGCDFCDFCTVMDKKIKNATELEKPGLQAKIETHRKFANDEYTEYN